MKDETFDLFLTATPGLETAVEDETRALLQAPLKVVEGGVELKGTLLDAAGLALWSRCAARVLVRLGEVAAASLQQLHVEVQKLPWERLIPPDHPFVVHAAVREARFIREDAVEHHVELAIRDHLRAFPRRGPPRRGPPPEPLEVRVRVLGRVATLSLDAGGGLLHRRGWRLATAKAPIRENLAASALLLAGWRPGAPLVDPMCGAGTFCIEAACWAAQRAPGLSRSPAILAAPGFPMRAWQEMLAEARAAVVPAQGVFLAGDRDTGALRATRENAARAGVDRAIQTIEHDMTRPWPNPPQGPGLVIFNPPYGVRVAENVALASVYHRVGAALQRSFPGWRVAAVCPDRALAGRLAPQIEEIAAFDNGGIPVRLWVADL